MSSKPSRHSEKRLAEDLLAEQRWLASVASEESEDDLRSLALVAVLTRCCLGSLHVTGEQQERALHHAMREWDRVPVAPADEDRRLRGLRALGRFGHWMQWVFTLGRRR